MRGGLAREVMANSKHAADALATPSYLLNIKSTAPRLVDRSLALNLAVLMCV